MSIRISIEWSEICLLHMLLVLLMTIGSELNVLPQMLNGICLRELLSAGESYLQIGCIIQFIGNSLGTYS